MFTYDLKDLFNNIHVADLHTIINTLFVDYHHTLQVPDNIDTNYFKSLTTPTARNIG